MCQKWSENWFNSSWVIFSNRKKLNRIDIVWKCKIFQHFNLIYQWNVSKMVGKLVQFELGYFSNQMKLNRMDLVLKCKIFQHYDSIYQRNVSKIVGKLVQRQLGYFFESKETESNRHSLKMQNFPTFWLDLSMKTTVVWTQRERQLNRNGKWVAVLFNGISPRVVSDVLDDYWTATMPIAFFFLTSPEQKRQKWNESNK